MKIPQLQPRPARVYDEAMHGFSDYLRMRGRITDLQLKQARSRLETLNLKTGLCALAFGFIEEPQIRQVLTIQRRTGERFGQIAVDQGLLTADQLATILRIQEKYRISLEDVLVMDGVLTREQLFEEERLFQTAEGKPSASLPG